MSLSSQSTTLVSINVGGGAGATAFVTGGTGCALNARILVFSSPISLHRPVVHCGWERLALRLALDTDGLGLHPLYLLARLLSLLRDLLLLLTLLCLRLRLRSTDRRRCLAYVLDLLTTIISGSIFF